MRHARRQLARRAAIRRVARRRGVTLVELLVVLLLLGLVVGVTGLAVRRTPAITPDDSALARVSAARDSAVRSARAVSVVVALGHGEYRATALPDGRVIADRALGLALGLDPLTGRRSDGRSDATR